MVMKWKEMLESGLIRQYGKDKGSKIGSKYKKAFIHRYMEDFSVDAALIDIEFIEKLSDSNPLELDIYPSLQGQENSFHLRVYQWHRLISLSDILPMLENFDLRTEHEQSYQLDLKNGELLWISDFIVTYEQSNCDIASIKANFTEAFIKVFSGKIENDGLNKLVLGAGLSWREVIILRFYTKYLLQIRFRFSQLFIEKTLANNPVITRLLIELFKERHGPFCTKKTAKPTKELEDQIVAALDTVENLDEDGILRRFLNLIQATLRTTYFQFYSNEADPIYLAMKLDSNAVQELPLPKPLYEIFVYSPHVEGIHLRSEKIARGGIRWSDRTEDFRTEVLGLMKAQVVKNSIIVPSGAKGGFVLKNLPSTATRAQTQQLVTNGYELFIRALLALTDNYVNGKEVHPLHICCHDGFDPYLVVAADKGTATFSDLANALSKEYGFWLGDAFASGGSTGYDHKKMGITARGVWESILRHFSHLQLDIQTTDVKVVGIGDMSGDVFGNGMLYSERLKLIAAFDHRHIFIDPSPDPAQSYLERKRLFDLPTSSWEDYNPTLISKGGGVFNRSLKSIRLTPEMRQVLAVDADALTPTEMVSAILKAPVDLLFNGGIGTYVKSINENAMDVGDRANDYCRINGEELRCKVVGEGGNLGFTQLGRIEYAFKGGLIYTDFIDNAAGVNCSDHEVNLKILLDSDVTKGRLSMSARDKLLASLTDEVAELVLKDNRLQALVLSYSENSAKTNISLHIDYIQELENLGILNRKVAFLPDTKALIARKASGYGLTRPELAVLLAYTKIYLKTEILKSALPEDPFLSQIIVTSFPLSIRKKYQKAIFEHPLKRDIIATQLSNELVNAMGLTFIFRMQNETGASIEEIIRAYTMVSNSFETPALQEVVGALECKISMNEQFDILRYIRRLINLSTRWILYGNYHKKPLPKVIAHFSKNIKVIEKLVPELMSGMTKDYQNALREKFRKASISEDIAIRISAYRAIYAALNIIEVATNNKVDLKRTAVIYFAIGEKMKLVWFRDYLGSDMREDYWNALTRLTLRDELDALQRALTLAVVRVDEGESDVYALIDKWMNSNQVTVNRWSNMLLNLHNSATIEYAMFFIAIRELNRLIV